MAELLKLSKKTIPTLLELYRSHNWPKHAVTYSALKNFKIQSEKFAELDENLELFTLNDNWQEDGLFLIKNGDSYYFDSMESQPFDRVKEMLLNIDYSNEVVFRAVRDEFKPMMNEVFWIKNVEISKLLGLTSYFYPKEGVAKFPDQPIPEGWALRSMTLDDLPELNQNVDREGGDLGADGIGYLETVLKYKMCVGLFNEKGKLQCWIFENDLGTHGGLRRSKEFRHKGAAGALGVEISRMVVDKSDSDTIGNISHGNDIAHVLARRFGGIKIGTVTFTSVKKRKYTKVPQLAAYQIFYPKL